MGTGNLNHTLIVSDLPANYRQNRSHTLEIFIGNREVISIKHSKVAAVADFNRSDVIFFDEPFIGRGCKPEGLLPCEHLITKDRLSSEILTGDDRVKVQPGIDDC